MKKTLIALAALATTAAFAQSSVNLTGKFGTAYQQAPGARAGLAVTDGDVRFTAIEDLGGGMKATAAMEVRVRGRGAADDGSATGANSGVGGRNATVNLTGGFGSLTLGAVEAGNGIIGRGFAGAPVSLADGYDGSVLSGVANVDWLMYAVPVGPVVVNYQRVDSIGTPGGGVGGNQANVFGVSYAAGPISAGLDYTVFKNNRAAGFLYAAGTTQGEKRTRLSASYDLGVATLGFGVEKNSDIAAQYALGAKIPFGAVTAGVIFAKNNENDAKGFGIGADYAFSKRTVLNVSYGKVDGFQNTGTATAPVQGVLDDSQYRIRLMHSF